MEIDKTESGEAAAGALDTPEAAVVTQVVEDAERFYAKAEIEITGTRAPTGQTSAVRTSTRSGHRSWFAQHRDNPGRIRHLNATGCLKSVPLI